MEFLPKEIREGNTKIAEFMDATIEEWYSANEYAKQTGLHVVFPLGQKTPGNVRNPAIDSLKYNESLDWLVPVIEKIHEFGLEVCVSTADAYIVHLGVEDERYLWLEEFYKTHGELYLDRHDEPDMVKRLWKVIVKFIDWHNENVKK